jgi:hypothetical protein
MKAVSILPKVDKKTAPMPKPTSRADLSPGKTR